MRKIRVLIVGAGDVVQRALPDLTRRFQVYALARSESAAENLRQSGVRVVRGDLDQRASLRRIAGIGQWLIHSAPPQNSGETDLRTRRLLAALARRRGRSMVPHPPRRAVYISTSGVYGDCQGALVSETRTPRPRNARAIRRLDAEQQLRRWASRNQVRLGILRAPGIYAAERLPIERLKQATPCIVRAEDSFSNHIHADDLARLLKHTLLRGKPLRCYNASDNLPLPMGDWFELVAKALNLPLPPRLPRIEVERLVSPALCSFLGESRQLDNQRLRDELRFCLQWPNVSNFLDAMREDLKFLKHEK